ncbi:MAG: hypothetical protein ACOC5T_00980 [Elusimicrobiota bacterium]
MFFNNGKKIALVSDYSDDYNAISDSFNSIDYQVDWYRSDCYIKLATRCDKYNTVLIEFRLGGGVLSTEIAKYLFKSGFDGKIFFLIEGSMEIYRQRYGTLLMKNSVIENPEIVLNTELDVMDQICDTTFIKDKITKGGF